MKAKKGKGGGEKEKEIIPARDFESSIFREEAGVASVTWQICMTFLFRFRGQTSIPSRR